MDAQLCWQSTVLSENVVCSLDSWYSSKVDPENNGTRLAERKEGDLTETRSRTLLQPERANNEERAKKKVLRLGKRAAEPRRRCALPYSVGLATDNGLLFSNVLASPAKQPHGHGSALPAARCDAWPTLSRPLLSCAAQFESSSLSSAPPFGTRAAEPQRRCA